MVILVFATDGTNNVPTVAHVHRDASVTWGELDDPDDRLLEDCGDIVLNLLECWDPSDFFADAVLERWARGWTFSLAGMPEPKALRWIHLALVFPVVDELLPKLGEMARDLEVDTDALDDKMRQSLDFPIRVNGALLRDFLCDAFDGPFSSDEARLGAILLRNT